MKIKNQPDFYSGLMFMATGVAFAWGATAYKVGGAARMGPGYFPLMLGLLMAIIGGIIMFKALAARADSNNKETIGSWAWKPLFYVIGANVVFGVLLAGLRSIHFPAFGLIVAIFALTFIAAMAQEGWKFKPTLALATALATGSYLVFVVALALQFQVWPAFITG